MNLPLSGYVFLMTRAAAGAALASSCAVCGLMMSWRRRWANNREDVKYCPDACRRRKAARG